MADSILLSATVEGVRTTNVYILVMTTKTMVIDECRSSSSQVTRLIWMNSDAFASSCRSFFVHSCSVLLFICLSHGLLPHVRARLACVNTWSQYTHWQVRWIKHIGTLANLPCLTYVGRHSSYSPMLPSIFILISSLNYFFFFLFHFSLQKSNTNYWRNGS